MKPEAFVLGLIDRQLGGKSHGTLHDSCGEVIAYSKAERLKIGMVVMMELGEVTKLSSLIREKTISIVIAGNN